MRCVSERGGRPAQLSCLSSVFPAVSRKDGVFQIEDGFHAVLWSCQKRNFDWTMEPLSLPDPQSPSENSSSVPQKKYRVLVGVTGSVAALKLPLLISQLLEIPGLEVKVVTTERAKHFYNAQEIPVTLYSDVDEWQRASECSAVFILSHPQLWKGRSDPVLHIDLRRWADLMLVAPLDANTLAKLANGICDNLLTCVIRAWDLSKPLLFCPAMNTAMWEHPITAQQVEQLKGFGYTEIPCVVKKLVCGDEGLSPQGLFFQTNFCFMGFIHKGVCLASTQAVEVPWQKCGPLWRM
ncbi:phosphopantothenoylcysteine decarboxylase isoform X3 [Apteryx rowi]|uniref:phosphopantothenoylcysteine decarboxylase isoform X3 n=1 Tax=Apteryx rowi TaxID=308060 RepID=UPI000E1DE590|nr:phosphopantothenoylcysteine decarboxylase isoform X3 [Apteryx rowi]XP_025923929.1 phosphopantothenoylcysteine decarboxylase isoform X3 [Apteryx rowi]XP_025923930.1 phosphopantothenoylcysteine decarboxylase isoform X3 [Apteryx rowi]XP_025923931.1 phosphopantothenoylcysteine decarboxylase isoform X3 [Apteryx rowi]